MNPNLKIKSGCKLLINMTHEIKDDNEYEFDEYYYSCFVFCEKGGLEVKTPKETKLN